MRYFSRDFPQITNGKEKSARFLIRIFRRIFFCALQQQNLPADRLCRISFRSPNNRTTPRCHSSHLRKASISKFLFLFSIAKLPFSQIFFLHQKNFPTSEKKCVSHTIVKHITFKEGKRSYEKPKRNLFRLSNR